MAILETVDTPRSSTPALKTGLAVEVRNRFTQTWSRGFEISEIVAEPANPSYRIRRLSDGAVLPDLFAGEVVRRCA